MSESDPSEPISAGPTPPGRTRATNRLQRTRLIIATVIAVVIAVAVTIGVVATTAGKSPPRQSTSPSVSTSPSASSTPESPSATPSSSAAPSAEPTPDPEFGEPVAEVVGPDDEGSFGNGVTVRVADIIPFEYEAAGVGEVSGSAARVELALVNGSPEPLDLAGTVVNAYYGDDRVPAPPVNSDGAATAFAGSADVREVVSGSYSFSVPDNDIASLVVTVSTGAGVPIVVFDPR